MSKPRRRSLGYEILRDKVVIIPPKGEYEEWRGVRGEVTNERPFSGNPNGRSVGKFDTDKHGWHSNWADFDVAWLRLDEPLTPFEESIRAYIAAEKKELGL